MRLFEIHDHPLFPRFLRDMVTDALQVLWSSSNLSISRSSLGCKGNWTTLGPEKWLTYARAVVALGLA